MNAQLEICDAAKSLVSRAKLYLGGHAGTPPPDLTEPCEACIMELVSQVEMLCNLSPEAKWSDNPATTSVVIRKLCIGFNDGWKDEERQLLLPYALKILGTKASLEVEIRRAFIAADWAIREIAPIALEARGLKEQAQKLRDLPQIVDRETARAAAAAAYAAADAAADAAAAAAPSVRNEIIASSLRLLDKLIEVN